MRDVVLDVFNQIGFGFVYGETGDFFQHLKLALFDQGNFGLLRFHGSDLGAEGFVLLLQCVGLAVEGFFLLLKAAFLLLHLTAAQLLFPLKFRAVFVYFFLCLHESFSLFALCIFYRFVDNTLGLVFGAADLAFRDLLPIHRTGAESDGGQDKQNDNPYKRWHR